MYLQLQYVKVGEFDMPNIAYTPAWKKHEAGAHSEDTKTQIAETDKFLGVRAEEMAKDPQAKKWEEDRVKEWARNKPHAVKERLKAEKAEQNSFNAGLRVGGKFNQQLRPVPGFLIIEMEAPPEKSEGGIFLPQEVEEVMRNTGTVLDTGNDLKDLSCPCHPGDKVMLKKGAGLELQIKDRDCRMVTFTDVLGVFYD